MMCRRRTRSGVVMGEPDSCAAFDPHHRGFRRDPFPTLERMRLTCPIARSDAYGGFWAVTRYRDVLAVLRDPTTFRSGDGVFIPPLGVSRPMIPMELDPPR